MSLLTISRVLLTSCVSICCFAVNSYYPPHAEEVYRSLVVTTKENTPGTTSTSSPGSFTPPTCPSTAFVEQGFLLWDYLVGVHTNDDCIAHFKELQAVCQKNKFTRVILFIPSPQTPNGATKFEFFQSQNTGTDSFQTAISELVQTMRVTEGITEFYVSIFFENGFFGSDVTTAPAFVSPYTSVETAVPNTYLSGYFEYLPAMLNWAAYMVGQDIGIEEIAFDPESYPAKQENYQTVYNYTDNYRWAYGIMYTPHAGSSQVPVRLGTTHGIDESKITYSSLFTFPVDPIFTASTKTYFPNPKPSWRQVNSEMTEEGLLQPLLNSVYIQAYQSNMPAMFEAGATSTGGHDGSEAAVDFNSLLRDVPYIIGEGKISCTIGDATVTGLKTDFLSYKGEDSFLFKMDTPLKKIGIIGDVKTNNSMDLSFGPTITTTRPIPFQKTEIITAWDTQTPGISQDVINNIYWMFSVNYDTSVSPPLEFFGNWNLCDFMDFIKNLNSENVTNPVFPGFTFPTKNYAIYDLSFLETVVNTVPVPPWNVAPAL